jgi:hypothetical protein
MLVLTGQQHYYGLAIYDPANLPMYMAGNVFLGKAEPSKHGYHVSLFDFALANVTL